MNTTIIWVLSVCIQPTWAGCGSYTGHEFSSEEGCYKALSTMTGKNDVVAYCFAKKIEVTKK